MQRPPSDGKPVFVYGSLMWPSVLNSLLGRTPRSRPALLRGFRRWRVRGERFPAIYDGDLPGGGGAEEGEAPVIRGLVLDDLLPEEAAIFDEFEDDEYDKRPVRPQLVEGCPEDPLEWVRTPAGPSEAAAAGEAVEALAYVWTEGSSLEDVAWVPERDFEPYEGEYGALCDSFVEEELPEALRSWRRAGGASPAPSPAARAPAPELPPPLRPRPGASAGGLGLPRLLAYGLGALAAVALAAALSARLAPRRGARL